MAHIRDGNRLPWIICKRCGASMRPGGSCQCGAVRTKLDKAGIVHIEEDGDSAVVDTEG